MIDARARWNASTRVGIPASVRPVARCGRAPGGAMSEPERGREPKGKVDAVAILYILGGIPAIVAYVVILFTLVRLFPSIPA